jgi:hypothetical protein
MALYVAPSGESGSAKGGLVSPTPVTPPGVESLTTVLNWLAWGVTVACVAGVLAAAQMAIRHRRGEDGSESLGRVGIVLLASVLGSAAGPLVSAIS